MSLRTAIRRTAGRTLRAYFAAQSRLRGYRPRFLIQLGHMRSGSTVLTHILNTNPQIMGFGETHIRYRSAEDLQRLVYVVHRQLRQPWLRDAWIFDKVLHANKFESGYLAGCARCRFLFLIREPESSLRSMMHQFPTWWTDALLPREELQAKAAGHYDSQLRAIMQFADRLAGDERALFFTHAQLLSQTAEVFRALERLLRLRVPLSERYQLLSTTGTFGIGDPSPHIRRGYLDRAIPPVDLVVDAEVVASSRSLFEACCARLQRFAVAPAVVVSC